MVKPHTHLPGGTTHTHVYCRISTAHCPEQRAPKAPERRREGTRRWSSLHNSVTHAFPPGIRVAGRGAQINVNDMGGGEEGCCLVHNIHHHQGLRVVRGLLHTMLASGRTWYAARVSAQGSGRDRGDASRLIVCDMIKAKSRWR